MSHGALWGLLGSKGTRSLSLGRGPRKGMGTWWAQWVDWDSGRGAVGKRVSMRETLKDE